LTEIANTSVQPTRQVSSIVRWVLRELDAELGDLLVKVKNTKSSHHRGTCYWNADEWHGNLPIGIRHLLVCCIPRKPSYLMQSKRRNGPPPYTILDWKQALVAITAHEGTHVRQYLNQPDWHGQGHERRLKDGRTVHVNPPHFSEVDAEWAEFRLLKRWKERSNQ
jgi:hypothetical protein